MARAADAAARYFLSLCDPVSGGFRFAAGQPPTLMAASYALLGLEAASGLDRLDRPARERAAAFLLSGVRPDGSFRDPLFTEEDAARKPGHGAAYFDGETTAFCQQALDVLGEPAPPRSDASRPGGTGGLTRYLESLEWRRPWTDANRAIFALSQACYEIERGRSARGLLTELDEALDWLEARHAPGTGLWSGPFPSEPEVAMATSCHFTFYFAYRGRTIPYPTKVIDSCLALLRPYGLFCPDFVGHSCFDYDALLLLGAASAVTEHRRAEVESARRRAVADLLALQNPDGGFSHQKLRVRKLLGRPLPRALAARIAGGTYENGWRHLSCPAPASNTFSSWFRLLALREAEPAFLQSHRGSRRIPFLGYRHG